MVSLGTVVTHKAIGNQNFSWWYPQNLPNCLVKVITFTAFVKANYGIGLTKVARSVAMANIRTSTLVEGFP